MPSRALLSPKRMQQDHVFVGMFPGQGSQKVGMAKDLWEAFPIVRETFEEASDALGWSVSALCWENSDDRLQRTAYTQPAILTVSIAVQRTLEREAGFRPTVVLGHSLGEYGALVAAQALSFPDAVRLVHRRGQLMQDAAPIGTSGLAAYVGTKLDRAKELARNLSETGGSGELVVPANFNSPEQTVFGGTIRSLSEWAKRIQEEGLGRAVTLPVSGAFHTPLMRSAKEGLAMELERVRFTPPLAPMVPNVNANWLDAGPQTRSSYSPSLLVDQVTSPVLWHQSVECIERTITERGADLQGAIWVEVGPGTVLQGLSRKIPVHSSSQDQVPSTFRRTTLGTQDLAAVSHTIQRMNS